VPSGGADKGDTQANLKAVMEEVDRQVGKLVDGLKELGIENNTVVFFLSDNGPLPTFNRARTIGLRGSKLSLYEGGLRVPCIAHWPGEIPPNRTDHQTVLCGVDFLPTLVSLAGGKLPADVKIDGEDRSKALRGTVVDRQRPLFWEYGRNEKYFKYPPEKDRSPNLAMRDGKWKLLLNSDGSRVELHDLSIDHQEAKNRASTLPEETARMRRLLLEWRKSLP
jgi:arylsulfatase A-like enzyme